MPDSHLPDADLAPSQGGPDDTVETEPVPGRAAPAEDGSWAAVDFQDDDEFEPESRHRSRATTVLLVALVFMVGILVGVLLGRVLSPAPAAQVVYVLGDSGSASAPASPSASPSGTR